MIDFRSSDVSLDEVYDICIAGAGAAGIALALEFAKSNHRICLIESGSLEYDPDTQDLYRGEIVGHQYEQLDLHRLRFFGGTTNHWGGYCSPIKAYSFEAQPWIPHSGWPITQNDLMPYYNRAIEVIGIEREGWVDGPGWQAAELAAKFGDPELILDRQAFEDRAFMVEPARMGEMFEAQLSSSTSVDFVVNANLTEIMTNDTAQQIEGFRIRSLSGREQIVRGRFYILALGGIENPRLLLASSQVQKEGLGNGNDLVGRFFCDHAYIDATQLLLSDRENLTRYDQRDVGTSETVIFKDLSFEAQKSHELVSGMIRINPIGGGGIPGIESVKELIRSGRNRRPPDQFGHHLKEVISNIGPIMAFGVESAFHQRPLASFADLKFNLDPAPNPDSRVTLGDERDALGMRRVNLDWRLTDLDRRTFRWMIEKFAADVGATNFGRVHVDFDWADMDDKIFWHWHNIGTTRMGDDAKTGVVDAKCKVHGIENLYVAGSSVFSTSGAGPPTFTLIALAIRLADHLKTRL